MICIYFYDVPLYQQTIDKIYELIDSGEVKLGERFPAERELASRWGISRNSLRDAFHVLEHRGVIISRKGSGHYLRNKLDLDNISSNTSLQFESISHNLEKCSLYDIYCTRQMLEPKVIEDVARNASSEEIAEIKESYEKFVEIFNKSGNTKEELDIHRIYTNHCRNNFLVDMVEYACQAVEDLMLHRFQSEYYDKHTVEESLEAHRIIIEHIEKREIEQAGKAMYDHLQHTIDML